MTMLKTVGQFAEGQLLVTLQQVVDGLLYLHTYAILVGMKFKALIPDTDNAFSNHAAI